MKKTLLILAIAASLAACDSRHSNAAYAPQPYAQPAAAPAPVQAAPVVVQQDSGMKDMVTGAAIGAVAATMLNGSSRHAPATETRIIERRTVVNNYVPARPVAAPAKPAFAPAPRYSTFRSAPTAKPSTSRPAPTKYSSYRRK